MKIISFGYTAPALLAGVKSVTRREWKDKHAATFHAGTQCAAYDKSPRFHGKQIAVIELTHDPVKESSLLAPGGDWAAEGFAWMEQHGLLLDGESPTVVWRGWHMFPLDLWVIRFRVVELTP